MSTPEATRPPPKPELKQKPQIPSKPGANTSHTPLADKDMLNKNSGKVHEIVSKFNHHDDQPPAAGPATETGCQKKPKPPPTVKPKPNVRSPPQVRAEQAPPLPLKRRQSQRKDAEQNVSCDFTDGRRSAPDGKEFEQQSLRSRPDQEPRCEKNCTCICHLQRPGMKLVWVRTSEEEEEQDELKQTNKDTISDEESKTDEEVESEMSQSASSESDYSLNESQSRLKPGFKATLNIIERQLRRKSDPGPETVLQAVRSLPQVLPQLTKTHSASEEESIYEATIDLITPPTEITKKTSTIPDFQVSKSPPAIPPRMPLDKIKRQCVPRRVPLCSLSGASPIPKLPAADLGSSERLRPVRKPPAPPARANDRCLSNSSLTYKVGEDAEHSGGDTENKEQKRSPGLTRQKSLDMEAQMPEELLYQIYTETFISREIRRQTVCRSISKTSADYTMDQGSARLSTSSGAEVLRSSPIAFQRTLWQDQPTVRDSGILNTITPEECKYQESMFEVLTSEVSYLRSLRVLTDHFMESRELNDNLINRDKKTLFSNILRIREVSEKFLKDLEGRLDETLLLTDICDIINYHAQHNFPAYIDYVRNQVYQEKTFSSLMQSNVGFATAITHLQEDHKCQRLPFSSFLLLPFQRITRIKILTENILKRTAEGTKQEEMASKALLLCARPCRSSRRTVSWRERGELQEVAKVGTLFNSKPKFTPVYLFLFNDLLVLATKKGSFCCSLERYMVIDHAHRSLVQVHIIADQAVIGEDAEHSGGDTENKEQKRSPGLTRQKSLDMEAQMPEELLYQIYTETFISREIRRQTVCRSISKTSADYTMDQGSARLSTSSGAEVLRSSPIAFQRTLWQDQPTVRDSGILNTITPEECKYQESMFEVLTSEVSYLRSLRVLTDHFMESRELNDNLINRDKKTLFSNILRIREVSEKFLKDLEGRLDETLLLTDICDIINYHAQHNFPAYIDYVRNQVYQEKTFSSLMQSNVGFATAITHLQEDHKCQRLPFSSFLLLPFQRITRIKILTENILKRTAEGTKQEEMASKALAAVCKIIDECNTQVGKMKQMEELIEINKTLEFDKLKAVPIISQNRFLEKRGELQEVAKVGTLFNSKPKFTPVYLFLFNDLLVLATKKGLERYMVIDHAHRSLVQVHIIADQAVSMNLENCFSLTLLENHQGRMMAKLFKAPSESDMHRWLAAFPNPEDPNREQEEVIYEDWDCPQVQCVEQYIAAQTDELNLEPPEIINVIRKTNEGWYEGSRLSDGQKGWFPVKNVLEITSEHMRRRNLRERYRVMQAASAMTSKTWSSS
ncbi:uncharacterized protein arhgef15b [Neoarius graeffei]|uniref:uncharacterized protein arhgef15b n=1 Tax=Neoarius graeffei TaxID=443677 RepID=UPI00298D5238|nr:uncharacterized protein arhgef15b [Neoarius graeffei]